MTAPGAGVVSTTNAANGYKRSSGTSFAAPEAAALAAMARAIDPSLDQDWFKKLLRDTCTDLGEPGLVWQKPAPEPQPEPQPVAFKDVAKDAYYYAAVQWAVKGGITAGTGKDTFSPDEGCTRAQAVTFLYKANQLEK